MIQEEGSVYGEEDLGGVSHVTRCKNVASHTVTRHWLNTCHDVPNFTAIECSVSNWSGT
jgi:hypothetical protein